MRSPANILQEQLLRAAIADMTPPPSAATRRRRQRRAVWLAVAGFSACLVAALALAVGGL